MGFNTMTEVQELAIPIVLEHKDVVVRSKTGSGKTAAFLVPIIQEIQGAGHTSALVIVPTRELALQVASVATKLGNTNHVRVAIVYGGASINVQMQALSRGAELVIGTPGRIIDLMERGALKIGRIKFFVLDEADLMLDMGFIDDIRQILSSAPSDRQTLLFSATMPRQIVDMARNYMKSDATRLTVGEEEDITVSTITHGYYFASGRAKFAALMAYIEKFNPKKCIIFTSTQRESEFVHRFLASNSFDAIVMHGGMSQAQRERSLHAFKQHSRFLISTNLVSRGLDIPDITDIINFDAPNEPKTYIHRVGRSARMGKDGRAFTIFGNDQKSLMHDTRAVANVEMHLIDLDISKFRDIQLPEHERWGGGRDAGRGRSFGGERRFGGERQRGFRREGRGSGDRDGHHGRSFGGDRRRFHRNSLDFRPSR